MQDTFDRKQRNPFGQCLHRNFRRVHHIRWYRVIDFSLRTPMKYRAPLRSV